MKPRLLLACLTTTDVVARARAEFDAIIAEGPDDMTVAEVIQAAHAHQAEGIVFTNTLPFNETMFTDLSASVRVGATCSVGSLENIHKREKREYSVKSIAESMTCEKQLCL